MWKKQSKGNSNYESQQQHEPKMMLTELDCRFATHCDLNSKDYVASQQCVSLYI
ncbi:hypothetical protein BDE02_02G042000 [Populus trichocarpa]|nr:hypothetical protein BDE02_02G042000 [Populus trichocarpa]